MVCKGHVIAPAQSNCSFSPRLFQSTLHHVRSSVTKRLDSLARLVAETQQMYDAGVIVWSTAYLTTGGSHCCFRLTLKTLLPSSIWQAKKAVTTQEGFCGPQASVLSPPSCAPRAAAPQRGCREMTGLRSCGLLSPANIHPSSPHKI